MHTYQRRRRLRLADDEDEAPSSPQAPPSPLPRPPTPREDIRHLYGAPFAIYEAWEGTRWKALKSKDVHQPRCLSWPLLKQLKLDNNIEAYLKNLSLHKFATVAPPGLVPLHYEFLCTLNFTADKLELHCRLLNRPLVVTYQVMHEVFGFHPRPLKGQPSYWVAADAWRELTGFLTWTGQGAPSGQLREVEMGILHKFLALCILGKEQANKVNASECYMLWCAKKKKKIDATAFVWNQLDSMARHAGFKPSLSPITTALALHFGLFPATSVPPTLRPIPARPIDRSELKVFVASDMTLIPQEKRHNVRALLQKRKFGEGTSSSARDILDDGDEEDDAAEEEPIPPPSFTYDPDTGSSDAFQRFQAYFDASFGQFRDDVYQRFDTLEGQITPMRQQLGDVYGQVNTMSGEITHLREQVSAYDARMASYNQHLTDNTAHLADLEAQWASFTLQNQDQFRHPPGPPPGL